jgi:hypothetical protein
MAIQTIEPEATKPVRAETIEAKSSTSKAPVEPMRREVLDVAESGTRPSAGAWAGSHMRKRRRECEGEEGHGESAGAPHPEAQGKPHGHISGAATSI